MNKLVSYLLIALVLYCAVYGLLRWRKFIVMEQHTLKDQNLVVKEVIPGHDVRTDWKGNLKNQLNGPIFIIFYPLEQIEDIVHGYRKPIAATTP